MGIISLKDYAKQKNVSYEAVRQQVVRYAEDLGDHLVKDGRQQFLDDEAVAFLDSKRKKNPIAIYQIEKDEEIERLENQNKELLMKLAAAQEQTIKLQEEYRQISEKEAKIALLEADNEAARARAAEAERRADVADQERRDVESAIEKLQSDLEISEKGRSEAELRAQAAEDIAEINAQEAERAKAEADAARAELDVIKNRSFWKRLFNK